LLQEIEFLKGDDAKAVLTLTVERLRAEITEKENTSERIIGEHNKSKRDFEKRIDELMEQLNSKLAENEALKKTKDSLEKDHAPISSLIENKMSNNPLAAGEAVQLQNQITRLSEQLTYKSIELSDLKDQLTKVENEKSELTKKIAHLKTKQMSIKKTKRKKSK